MRRLFQNAIINGELHRLYGRTPTPRDDFVEIPADIRSYLVILDWRDGTAVMLNELNLRRSPELENKPGWLRFSYLKKQLGDRKVNPHYWSIHVKLDTNTIAKPKRWNPKEFAAKHFAAQIEAGKTPTQDALIKSAKAAGLKGGRAELRKEFRKLQVASGRPVKRGPPAKANAIIGSMHLPTEWAA